MVTMPVEFDWIVVEVERTERLHICDSQCGADVFAFVIAPAATDDLLPRLVGELRQGLIRFPAQREITFRLAQRSTRCCRRMRTDCCAELKTILPARAAQAADNARKGTTEQSGLPGSQVENHEFAAKPQW